MVKKLMLLLLCSCAYTVLPMEQGAPTIPDNIQHEDDLHITIICDKVGINTIQIVNGQAFSTFTTSATMDVNKSGKVAIGLPKQTNDNQKRLEKPLEDLTKDAQSVLGLAKLNYKTERLIKLIGNE